jgi:fatty acid desaturase
LAVITPTRPAPVKAAPAADYVVLKRRIKEAGLLESKSGYYWIKTFVAMATVAIGAAIAIVSSNPWIIVADALFMGFASTQVALLAHDVGHRQGYRGRRTNLIARAVFGNVLLAVSHSWWNDKHNQHHATPNHMEKDPDVQIPMLVFSRYQIASRPKWLRPMIAIQAFSLVFLMPFQAANMRLISLTHLTGPKANHRWLQAGLILLHFAAYGALLYTIGFPWGIAFALIHQATFGLYNSSVFASNHKGMPLTTDGTRLDFFREQVVTSRNVSAHPLVDFWYGGLNYQIEHHLFPTMPRCNLRKAQPIVEAFCKEAGVSYHTTGLFESYREVFSHLHRESASLRGGEAVA